MQPINRGTGFTQSERYLAKLADKTFLDLWSYPNTFNDKKQHGKGVGQELCDLLVVCGDDVIIFSDKSIQWTSNGDANLSWKRWYKRAVTKSVDQIRGAERWLRRYPDRVYIDSYCEQKLPIPLPPPERMRVHGIALALGAQKACSEHLRDDDGSLMVHSSLKGSDHTDENAAHYMPFSFGDVDPAKSFVHVFDETALDVVMREMDTISDFVEYLNGRAVAIRQTLLWASSEADLLAAYLSHERADGSHFFPAATNNDPEKLEFFAIEQGFYESYQSRPERFAKENANRVSYFWDELISRFSRHLLAGTSVPVAGHEPDIGLAEPALRIMALESRLSRRALANAFVEALRTAEENSYPRLVRSLLGGNGFFDAQTGYVFLILAYGNAFEGMNYDEYRLVRARMLEAYCEVSLLRNRKFKRMIGIAVDASPKVTGMAGGSEDLLYIKIDNWTNERIKEVKRIAKKFNILAPGNVRRFKTNIQEFPNVTVAPMPTGNRKLRRGFASGQRKKRT